MRLIVAVAVVVVALLVVRDASALLSPTAQQQNGTAQSSSPSASDAAVPFIGGGGPGNYYASINTALNGTGFREQLHALINPHTVLSYNALWSAFKELDTDTNGCTGTRLADIYSSKCWLPGTEQCGNYKKEGDCYNREHSWPKSWWGGDELPSYTDLFHLFPSDGYDNARRSNFALGEVDAPVYTTDSGCKLGPCSASSDAPAGTTCWEPAADTKGLLARAYFYMSTAYYGVWTCCDTDGVDAYRIKPWMTAVLRRWHATYPPTPHEQQRNDRVFSDYQGNRNPFIDFPEWADKIDFTAGADGRAATDDRAPRQRGTRRGGDRHPGGYGGQRDVGKAKPKRRRNNNKGNGEGGQRRRRRSKQ